jgi:tetratricopeptide (TPR) repeat protein
MCYAFGEVSSCGEEVDNMNTKYCFLSCFAVLFALGSYGLCIAQDQTATLTVKEIVFKADKGGREKVAVLCTQACVPALSSVEGKKPRIIMDFTGVSFIEPKYRNIPISGKYVKKIRSYLDKDSKKLRVLLDMDPSKHYVVHPTQDPTANAYSLLISEKKIVKGKYAKKSPRTKDSRIFITDQGRRPVDKDLKPSETAVKQAPVSIAGITEDKVSVEKGRSQMNAGNYAGAIHTFTEMIAKDPKDRLSYRLRGNAYQNVGDRQKAVGDWITAARLGDEIVQSYLDYMQINWKEAPKP